MKTKSTIPEIIERRRESEKGQVVCAREINENIKRVLNGKPLTRPLHVLNKSCEFRKRYNIACDLLEGSLEKKRKKEYREKNKEKINEKQREYYQKNKEKINEKQRGDYQKNKEKKRKYLREYYQRPEAKEKKRKYQREYYQKNKDKRRKKK